MQCKQGSQHHLPMILANQAMIGVPEGKLLSSISPIIIHGEQPSFKWEFSKLDNLNIFNPETHCTCVGIIIGDTVTSCCRQL